MNATKNAKVEHTVRAPRATRTPHASHATRTTFDTLVDASPVSLDGEISAMLELESAERQDDLSRTAPKLELTGSIGTRSRFLLGAAQISAVTTKIDKLLRTSRVANSAVLTKALINIKRDILAGLTDAKGAFDEATKR